MYKVLFSVTALFFAVSALPHDTRAAMPDENARTSGVETCLDVIERETAPFFTAVNRETGGVTNVPHVSHDFVSPRSRDVDKRPFYSMAFRNYGDVGVAHISIVAARSDVSRRSKKCDLHLTETFVSEKTCEEWSRDLSERNFRAAPLATDVTLMQNQGAEDIFSFYYLTGTPEGSGCLVSRRRMVYEP